MTSLALQRADFVDKVEERGDNCNRGVAICLIIINDDISISASFTF
jgi:hypothetical protein